MTKLNKRMQRAQFVSNVESIFQCPHCGSSMQVMELASLVCSNQHSFDFTKQGYVNLTSQAVKTKYSRELFEARRKIIDSDRFFVPLTETLAEGINRYAPAKKENIFILDAGCGEGSLFSRICDFVLSRFHRYVTGVGMDLSKEGVREASKQHSGKVWTVADLAAAPFQNDQFDVIFNILSPSNYAEFNRLLKMDGILIKVVPQQQYLKELRKSFFHESENNPYSNAETVDHFKNNFHVINHTNIHYKINLNHASLQNLIKMTPLTWDIPDKHVRSYLNKVSTQDITVDLDVFIGKKK
ncbi:putative RNA methyltransferase [Alteribacillus sp. JSM 102045]|uniref:putative RNA methyltransferase n=1 Tax=Alteribacillus sp. JSM 102045 TaxID=1562101 RepID=UPI0035C02989